MNIEITDAFLESIKGVKLNDKNILEMFDYNTYKISETRSKPHTYLFSVKLKDLLKGCKQSSENIYSGTLYSGTFKNIKSSFINFIDESLARNICFLPRNINVSETDQIVVVFDDCDICDMFRIYTEEKYTYTECEDEFIDRVREIISNARDDYRTRLRLNNQKTKDEQQEYQEYLRLKEKFKNKSENE